MFLVEFYIDTDGDYSYAWLDKFEKMSEINNCLYVGECETYKQAVGLIDKQIRLLLESIDVGSAADFVKKVLHEKYIEFTELENPYEFECHTGNQVLSFRIIEASKNYYKDLNNMAKEFSIDMSLLFARF
jgi:hypothetical protein